MHDGLGHEVPDALVDNRHVGVHQVTDGLHFTLQLRVHGEVIWGGGGLTLNLQRETAEIWWDSEREVHGKRGADIYKRKMGALYESSKLQYVRISVEGIIK